MKLYAKQAMAWVLAMTLLVTCAIGGLVLPAAAEETNLFVNGDFEEGATASWGRSAMILEGVGKDGSYGYYYERTETNSSTGTGQMRYKSALLTKMEASTKYVLSFDYKNEGTAVGQLYFDKAFGVTDDGVSMMANKTIYLPADATEWRTMTYTFITPEEIVANSGWEFSIRTIRGTGKVWADNFSLVKASEVVAPTATSVVLNKTALELSVGASETLTASVLPEGASADGIVWTTSDAAVATVENGKVTAVSAGAATITATLGSLSATCVVTIAAAQEPDNGSTIIYSDFNGTESGWKYNDTVEGLFTKNDPVPLMTDADGNKYIQIPANGKVIQGPGVDCDVKAGDWIRIDFKMRKNHTGKLRFGIQVRSIVDGYLQPDWFVSTSTSGTNNNGEWFTYTFYAKAAKDSSKITLGALQIAGNSAADVLVDLDDFKVTNLGGVAMETLPFLSNGTMDEQAAEYNDYGFGGMFFDGGEIEADPDDATNKVLHMTGSTQAYLYPDFRTYKVGTSTKTHGVQAEKMYKLTYRVKGTGTTSPKTVSSYATVLETIGEPDVASAEWKTVTVYIKTTASANNAYTFDFKTTGDVYLDDFTMVEVTGVDSITLDKTTIAEMKPGEEVVLTATTTPAGATVTWESSNTAVATVSDGKITAVAAGTATITATAGDKMATITVTVAAVEEPPVEEPGELTMINGDFNAAESGWKYGSTVEGLFTKNDPVPVMTDADGNKYIQIPANGKTILGPEVSYEIKAGDWIRVDFKVRKNHTGKMRFGIQVRGIFDGYVQPDWFMTTGASATNNNGEWFTYTFYAKAGKDATQISLGALQIAGNSAADVLLDLDDIKLTYLGAVEETALPLLSNGTMDEQAAEYNDYGFGGLFFDGGKIEVDPDDATNNVLHMTAASQAYLYPNFRTYKVGTSNKAFGVQAEKVYKLTYRMKGTGTTSPKTVSTYATVLETIGEPGVASAEWKTITVYIKTTASASSLYTFDFRTTGDVYLDDFTMVEVTDIDALALDKAELDEMLPGETVTLTATTTPAGYPVTWTSSDETVATVVDGKITAVGDGTATITATAGSKTATITVKVKDPGKATAIALDKTETTLIKGNTLTLTLTTTPAGSRYDSLTWTSSDETVATVANGVVTATDKEGEAVITATAMVDGAPLVASCKIKVLGNATSIEATVESLHLSTAVSATIAVTETIDLVVTPAGSYTGTLTWTSSDEAVATVVDGKVTARAEGTAIITVTNGTLSDTVTVKVDTFGQRVPGGDFEGDDWNIPYWSKIIAEGKAQVVVDPTNPDNHVMAIPANATAGWYMSPMVVNAGRTYKITYKAKSEAGYTEVYFEYANSVENGGWKKRSIAKDGWVEITEIFTTKSTLNRNYVVAFANHWDATLYIDDFSVVELPEATAIELIPDGNVELMPSGTMTLTTKTTPAEASAGTLTWTSSAPSIISVSSSGVITAVASEGKATITVTTPKGLTDSVEVTINEYANLLENGDFEAGSVNWKKSDGKVLPGVGKDGSYGYQVGHYVSERGEWYYSKALPVMPGTTYILSFDYYATPSSDNLRIFSNNISLGNLRASKGNGEWKTMSKVFTTSPTMKLNPTWDIAIVCDGVVGEDVIIDNISLKLYNSGIAAESITMNYSEMTLLPGRTGGLAISAVPVDGDINRSTWTSSDENVATVEYGVVTAVGKGTATITATTRSGLTATCKVTVSGTPALILNGTFNDTADDSWKLEGGAKLTPEVGSMNTIAAELVKDSTISQSVTGLKPETTYQLFVRYRAAATGSTLKATLNNGATALFEKTESAAVAWTTKTYEFTTGATLEDTSTLVFSVASGNGPIYLDNIFISEKASLVDLVVDSVVWAGGDEQVTPGTELYFAVTFSNKGEDPVKADSVIAIDICVDGTPIQTLNYTVGAAGFAGGTTDMIIGDTPWAAVKGDHVVSVRINPALSVLEMNTDNNNTVQTLLRVDETPLEIPELAELAGFTTLSFSEDFDSLDTIDMYGTGKDGYKWYVTRPYSTPNVETDDYEINDGIMTLKLDNSRYNYGLATMDIKTGIGYQYNYGYLEFRIRVKDYDENLHGGPAIWSLPYGKLVSDPATTRWVEMDWMEYWGTRGGSFPDGHYTVSVHDLSGEGYEGEALQYKNSNYSRGGLADQEWHTMGFLWDYGKVIAYLDGEMVMKLTYSEETGASPNPTIVKGSMLTAMDAFTLMDTQYLPIIICASLDNQMDIDYLRVWTGTGGGSIPGIGGDGEEEEEGTVVDMAAEDFWYNYCTDDWGDPIAAVNDENYQNVLYGKEIWEVLSEERRAEINALLESLGQPSYDEMLADALILADGGTLDEGDSPDTGEHARALPAVVALAALSAAVLWTSRKRRSKR